MKLQPEPTHDRPMFTRVQSFSSFLTGGQRRSLNDGTAEICSRSQQSLGHDHAAFFVEGSNSCTNRPHGRRTRMIQRSTVPSVTIAPHSPSLSVRPVTLFALVHAMLARRISKKNMNCPTYYLVLYRHSFAMRERLGNR